MLIRERALEAVLPRIKVNYGYNIDWNWNTKSYVFNERKRKIIKKNMHYRRRERQAKNVLEFEFGYEHFITSIMLESTGLL